MKRCILFKLVPGTDPIEIQEKLMKNLRKLDDALDWLNHPVIHRSCMEGDDYDLMVVVNIEEEERLPEFLNHPLKQDLEGKVDDRISKVSVFNHY